MKEYNFIINIIWISIILQGMFFGFVSAQSSIDEVQNPEKVFLHLDKDYYLSGTALRYSAYVVEAKNHKLSRTSSILDVKLFDINNDEILSQKLILENGKAEGKLELNKSIRSGNYLLLAFTKNSLIKNHKYSFKQKISIINPNEELPITDHKVFSIDFYPEGGQIIGGHLNTVAFKANHPNSNWKGVIVSNNGDSVAYIKPEQLNYGQFSFLANDTLNYKAKIKINEDHLEFELPKIQNNNISARIVNIESDTLSLIVNIGDDFPGNELSMLVYNNSEIILGAKQIIRGRRMIFNLPQSLLGIGLNSIFIYNEDQVILSERNFYRPEKKESQIELKIESDDLKKNENVSLPIIVDKNVTQSLELDASVSIKNLDYFNGSIANDMNLYFNLFSELNILNSGSIINELQGDHQFRDLFIKTRTTGYNYVSDLNAPDQNRNVLNFENKDYFIITGKVSDNESRKPIQDSVIYCSVIGQTPQFYASKTDKKGRFYFKVRSFSGQSDIILKVANIDEGKSNLKYELSHNNINIQDFGIDNEISINTEKIQNYINYQKQNDVISRVYNPTTVQEIERKKLKSTTGFFPNYSDSKDLTEYEYLESFHQLSRELLPGLAIKSNQKSNRIFLREIDDSGRNSFIGRFENEPLILIDGMPIFDNSKLLNYNTAKIKFVSLINEKYYINGVFHDGIIEIGTRDSDYYKQNNTNHHWFTMQGFYRESSVSNNATRFTEKNNKDQLPDFRDILYWNGNHIINSDKVNKIDFTSSDDVANFLVEIHGIDQYGNIIQYTTPLKVND
jgi:hypothetical protein